MTFYALQKVHKHQPPGHPIISGNCNLTERASKYIDFIIRPFVHELTSYIEDTRDTVNRLTDIVSKKDTIWMLSPSIAKPLFGHRSL